MPSPQTDSFDASSWAPVRASDRGQGIEPRASASSSSSGGTTGQIKGPTELNAPPRSLCREKPPHHGTAPGSRRGIIRRRVHRAYATRRLTPHLKIQTLRDRSGSRNRGKPGGSCRSRLWESPPVSGLWQKNLEKAPAAWGLTGIRLDKNRSYQEKWLSGCDKCGSPTRQMWTPWWYVEESVTNAALLTLTPGSGRSHGDSGTRLRVYVKKGEHYRAYASAVVVSAGGIGSPLICGTERLSPGAAAISFSTP